MTLFIRGKWSSSPEYWFDSLQLPVRNAVFITSFLPFMYFLCALFFTSYFFSTERCFRRSYFYEFSSANKEIFTLERLSDDNCRCPLNGTSTRSFGETNLTHNSWNHVRMNIKEWDSVGSIYICCHEYFCSSVQNMSTRPVVHVCK